MKQKHHGSAHRACALGAAALMLGVASLSDAQAAPITYSGFVVTDVSLGGHKYHNAEVTLTLVGDTKDITPFSVTAPDGQTGSGYMIGKGRASVQIVSAGKTVSAKFAPGQLLVSFDSQNIGIGFGSYLGPNGLEPAYPLAFTDGTTQYLDYTYDLSTPAQLSGKAWSCIGYPPVAGNGTCTAPETYPLKTSAGDLVIQQPYLFLDGNGLIQSDYSGSMNRGTFSVISGAPFSH
jgi:hypothetical protein